MSDPKEQRADGCSIFFTVISVILVSLAFVLIHEYLQPETPEGASLMTDKQRVSKISQYHEENNAYNLAIESFHSDRNSSLEQFMLKTVEVYKPDSNRSN